MILALLGGKLQSKVQTNLGRVASVNLFRFLRMLCKLCMCIETRRRGLVPLSDQPNSYTKKRV